MRHRATPERSPASPGAVVVGVFGEILITIGVLLGLFVVWQLWWTDVVAEQVQAQIVDDLGWLTVPTQSAPTAVQYRDAAPVLAEPPSGETFAVLYVPRWGADPMPVSEGTNKYQVLDKLGIGHYSGTAMPGGIGNFALAGHRTTYGKPFNRIEELNVGDPLVVRTSDIWYVYRVTSTEVVRPAQVDVIAPVPGDPQATPTEAMMTLTTCHPMYSARERYIVHALLDYWVPADEDTPVDLAEGQH